MTYEARVQAQRSAIQPETTQCELRFSNMALMRYTGPQDAFNSFLLFAMNFLIWALAHAQFSMKNQPHWDLYTLRTSPL